MLVRKCSSVPGGLGDQMLTTVLISCAWRQMRAALGDLARSMEEEKRVYWAVSLRLYGELFSPRQVRTGVEVGSGLF